MQELVEPKGIAFYSVKNDETHYCKLEPTISAYINSSDMGINASRGQDQGWRLAAEWVKRVRAFRQDRTQMQILASANQGQKPTTVQILYYLYGEELRVFQEDQEENENPFEEQYQRDISSKPQSVPSTVAPTPLPSAETKAEGSEDANSSQPTDSTPSTTKPVQEKPAANTGDKPADLSEKSGKATTPKK